MISKPSNLFLIFSLFIVFLLLFPIYEVNYEFSAFSYIFLFFCFFSSYAGLFLGEIILSPKNSYHDNKDEKYNVNFVFNVILLLSILGTSLFIYELFVNRIKFKFPNY